MLNSVELCDRDKLPSNHGNYHLVMHWPHIIMSTLSCHVYEGHTDQNAAPLSGKYRLTTQHIPSNCNYIPSSISESYGSPKTTLYCT